MAGKPKKSILDVGYLRTATASPLASSILATTVQEKTQQLIHEQRSEQIPIDRLLDNPYQPRVAMEETSLKQLAETIASQGFHGLLVARPHPEQEGMYQITAGHRRRAAARLAGLRTLPVIVHPWSDQEMATLSVTENIQREDLSPLEEGRLFQLLIEQMGMTQMEIASSIKKDRGYVRNRLRLANAPADIQAFVASKTDSLRAVIYLLDIDDEQERALLIDRLLKRTLTTEDLSTYLENRKQRQAASPPSQGPMLAAEQSGRPDAMVSVHQPSRVISTASKLSGRQNQPEMGEEHMRSLRLSAILRTLNEYQKRVAGQPTLSQEERALLRQILTLAQDLAVL